MSAKSRAVAGPPRTQQHGGMHRQPPRTIAEKVAPAVLGGRKLAVAGLIGSAALASPGVAAWASPGSIALAHRVQPYTAHDLAGAGAPFEVYRVGQTAAARPGGPATREVPPRHPGARLPARPAHHLSQQRLRVTQRPEPQSSPVVLTSAVSPMTAEGDAAPAVAPATAPGGSGTLEPAWLSGQPQAQAGGQQDPGIFPSSWQSQAGAPSGTQHGNGDLGSQLDPGTMTAQAAGSATAGSVQQNPGGPGGTSRAGSEIPRVATMITVITRTGGSSQAPCPGRRARGSRATADTAPAPPRRLPSSAPRTRPLPIRARVLPTRQARLTRPQAQRPGAREWAPRPSLRPGPPRPPRPA